MATKFNKENWMKYKNTGEFPDNVSEQKVQNTVPDNINAIYEKAKELNIETEPLNIVRVVKEIYGINLYYNDLDRDTSGFIERISPQKWAIHVNRWENSLRQKFTIAHELAHFILHRNILQSGSHYDSVLYRDENTSVIEREANSFASNLLMPADKFEQYIKDGENTIEKLADKFQLSTSAVRYRAYKLNYIQEY